MTSELVIGDRRINKLGTWDRRTEDKGDDGPVTCDRDPRERE
ncbi:uncharacterized protein J3R85_015828 [Psidium guajava]|nr:uncharacterized protein J3R85_015828 [Psidium guajava]